MILGLLKKFTNSVSGLACETAFISSIRILPCESVFHRGRYRRDQCEFLSYQKVAKMIRNGAVGN
jgi:hypothetical protein